VLKERDGEGERKETRETDTDGVRERH